MERKRFWFAVAPTIYVVKRNCNEKMGVFRRRYAVVTWIDTTSSTTHFVKGSWPQSFVTSG